MISASTWLLRRLHNGDEVPALRKAGTRKSHEDMGSRSTARSYTHSVLVRVTIAVVKHQAQEHQREEKACLTYKSRISPLRKVKAGT